MAPHLGHLGCHRLSGDGCWRHRHRGREVRFRRSRLDRLEGDVLDESRPLAPILRQVITLGGHAHSEPLRAWALRELQGYEGTDVPIPDYRRISAPPGDGWPRWDVPVPGAAGQHVRPAGLRP
ncbi:hypothetical protein [Streptomyces sp. NPDC004658]|uniref:AbiTii domain-containing protein n=1 Tax=Streptomyces sp. NPDC004658 TaxID=3154672 RepID=UPI0033A651C7